ncbi:uncharacterized protein [Hoplias malabaricus]|uniref:uncharacterized protein n=1 Tax=Hoplias malabaricus TaxID=27720 RepID=UPI003463133E
MDFLTRVYVIIHLLPLFHVNIALLEPDKPTVHDLKCFNDYHKQMVCYMSLDKLSNCSDYKLNVSFETSGQTYYCHFEFEPLNDCQCKFQVQHGFNQAENFKCIPSKGEASLFSKEISISINKSIKPKRPNIISAKRTQNGGFIITWDTNYSRSNVPKVFVEGLSTQLIYGVNGSSNNVTQPVAKGVTEYEIVGSKFQPNSNYFVMARVSTDYNQNAIFSDCSEPYEFITLPSETMILKTLVPIICVILVIFIFTTFFCFFKIKNALWDTFPSPKISSNFTKQIYVWHPPENEISLVHVEDCSVDLVVNRAGPLVSHANVNNELPHCRHLGSDLALVEHVQVHYGTRGQDRVTENAEVSKLETMSYNALENLQSTRNTVSANSSHEIEKNLGNSSVLSFCNRSYFKPLDSCKNETLLPVSKNLASTSLSEIVHNKQHTDLTDNDIPNDFRNKSDWSFSNLSQSHKNEKLSSDFSKNLNPVIPIDFDPGHWEACLEPTDDQSRPSNSDTVVIPGYKSVNEVLDQRNKLEADASMDHTFINHNSDVNLILAKPACCKKPQEDTLLACESSIIPVEVGYQSFLR